MLVTLFLVGASQNSQASDFSIYSFYCARLTRFRCLNLAGLGGCVCVCVCEAWLRLDSLFCLEFSWCCIVVLCGRTCTLGDDCGRCVLHVLICQNIRCKLFLSLFEACSCASVHPMYLAEQKLLESDL
jgi:hypothetical protein